ncbi:MAG: nicotinate-nucleotide adenylyltransferase [Nitrospirota bacterium]
MKTKIGIFGGTFNPVHYGHLRCAEEVRERLNLDLILFVPAKNPPLKAKDIAPPEQRYEMLKLALRGNKHLRISDIEYCLTGRSYTVRTIETLQGLYPDAEYYFVLGIDAFLDIPNWWHPERLIAFSNFVITSRPGYRFSALKESPYLRPGIRVLAKMDRRERPFFRTKLVSGRKAVLLHLIPVGISSTEIRRLVRNGKSVKYLLPPKVESFIISNKLYTGR